jgi:hypothetical protein
MLRAKPNRWKFDPDEPRDESGRWTDGGGSGESGSDKPAPADKPAETLDPKVVEVGGDEWNKATARRLEREYQQEKPKIEKIATDAVGKKIEAPDEEQDEPAPGPPESWDEMTSDLQDQAYEKYKAEMYEKYHDNEISNWHDSGGALDDAKSELAYTTMHGPGSDHDEWLIESLNDLADYRDEHGQIKIPFDAQQLVAAITMDYEGDGEGGGKLIVNFDDSQLQEPSNLPPSEQGTLPGIEPVKPHEQLTEEMRKDIIEQIQTSFQEQAEKKASDMEPPDYLKDSVTEMIESDWEHNMDDKSKFNWVTNNTDLIEDDSGKPDTPKPGYYYIEALPEKYDPLNDTTGKDYQRTQALARYLSVHRAQQVLEDRGLLTKNRTQSLAAIDTELWSSWKASSTSADGRLLQLATAEELNGRLNQKQIKDDAKDIRAAADSQYQHIGGYAGIKAYVRAKWEVSQYLLDKAGVKNLELYRGIRFEKEVLEKRFKQVTTEVLEHLGPDHDRIFNHLPNMHVERNGAASTTTDPGVANDWSAHNTRVVLRAVVPRTAALSVPAYGINMQSEHEVVVAGTAWKGWDAWKGTAPSFKAVPLQQAA